MLTIKTQMKSLILRGGLKTRRGVFVDGRRWSLKWALNNYLLYGRNLVRSIFEAKAGPSKQSRKWRPSNSIKNCESVVTVGSRSKGLSWPGGQVSRLVSKWSSGSWAAELRRNAAKRLMFQSGRAVPLFTLLGFTLAKEPSLLSESDQYQMACHQIREVFKEVHRKEEEESRDDFKWPSEMSRSNLQFGKILAKGCNAVVYDANLSRKHGEDLVSIDEGQFGVAVKLMFNYDAESNASSIWRAMHRESIPARLKYLPTLPDPRRVLREFHLPPHPNIVDMHCAFADDFPNLPEGTDLYPDALPMRLNRQGFGRNMTLFLVMKRYDTSLKEYLQRRSNAPLQCRTSLLLLTQLLEGLVHLRKHRVSHRDLKTDNILLDLSDGDAAPLLVITDFGCCLADPRLGFHLPFHSEDVFRGGNVSLMPPEVSTAVPGMFSTIDYSKSDLWVAGALAYEIFCGKNPFYPTCNPFHLDSFSYDDDREIPAFPGGAPPELGKIVSKILRRNPKQRPGVETVATSCQLLLHAPGDWIQKEAPTQEEIVCWLAETALRCLGNEEGQRGRGAEQVLLATFLARVTLDGISQALQYLRSL